jgi:hypothetical protein
MEENANVLPFISSLVYPALQTTHVFSNPPSENSASANEEPDAEVWRKGWCYPLGCNALDGVAYMLWWMQSSGR